VGYNPSYKWINPTYPIYNWGYNPLTKWDEPPSSGHAPPQPTLKSCGLAPTSPGVGSHPPGSRRETRPVVLGTKKQRENMKDDGYMTKDIMGYNDQGYHGI